MVNFWRGVSVRGCPCIRYEQTCSKSQHLRRPADLVRVPSERSAMWNSCSLGGTPPDGRVSHSATLMGDDRVHIIGGGRMIGGGRIITTGRGG